MLSANYYTEIIILERAKMRAGILVAELVSREISLCRRFFQPNSLFSN